MTGTNLRAGRDWEDECARLGRSAGFLECDRENVRHPDRGDLRGVPGWTLECKSLARAVTHTPAEAWARLGPPARLALARDPAPADAFKLGYAMGQKEGLRWDMAAAVDQLAKAQATRGTAYGAVLRKRPRVAPGRGFAIMPLDQFWVIARELAEAPARHQVAAALAAHPEGLAF
jgi:hypothetical protein